MTARPSDPAILFDLDGTLVDTNYQHVISWSAALRGAGLSIPEWKIHRRIGMSGRSLVRQLVRENRSGDPEIDPEKLEKSHDAFFNKSMSTIDALPGAEELLCTSVKETCDGPSQRRVRKHKRKRWYAGCGFLRTRLSLPETMWSRPNRLLTYS